jgi:hypothetical protein
MHSRSWRRDGPCAYDREGRPSETSAVKPGILRGWFIQSTNSPLMSVISVFR